MIILFNVGFCFLDGGPLPEKDSRVFIKEPQQDPAYITGRLPGEGWIEHNPARFHSLQSFETRDSLDKCVLVLKRYQQEGAETEKEFIDTMLNRLKVAREHRRYSSYENKEGRWQQVTLRSDHDETVIVFYVIAKNSFFYTVQYIAANANVYALYKKDVKRYVDNFWFLYRSQ